MPGQLGCDTTLAHSRRDSSFNYSLRNISRAKPGRLRNRARIDFAISLPHLVQKRP